MISSSPDPSGLLQPLRLRFFIPRHKDHRFRCSYNFHTAKMKMPENIVSMRATLIDQPFDDNSWLFEIKYDGFRIVAYIQKGIVKLRTKKNTDYKFKSKPITDELAKWKVDAVIDGEVVVLNKDGVSDFDALLNWKRGSGIPIYYYVFDLLFLNGNDYMKYPLRKRKAILKDIHPQSRVVLRLFRLCDAEVYFCMLWYINCAVFWPARLGFTIVIALYNDFSL